MPEQNVALPEMPTDEEQVHCPVTLFSLFKFVNA